MQAGHIVGHGIAGASQRADVPSPRLLRAAHEFEGQMMKELMKPLTEGDALTGAEDDSQSGAGAGGALSEFASETLGQALSQKGGLGIADRIVGSLPSTGNQKGSSKVIGVLHGNTWIKAPE